MKLLSTIITLLLCYYVHAQGVNISGTLQDDTEAPVIFANLALYDTSGSNLIKVETTDDTGNFTFWIHLDTQTQRMSNYKIVPVYFFAHYLRINLIFR